MMSPSHFCNLASKDSVAGSFFSFLFSVSDNFSFSPLVVCNRSYLSMMLIKSCFEVKMAK